MKLGRVFLRGLEGTSWVWALVLLALVVIPFVAPESMSDWAASWGRANDPMSNPGTQVDERRNFLILAALFYSFFAAACLASCWAFLDQKRARSIAAGEEVSRRRHYGLAALVLAACLWLCFHLSASVFFGAEEALREYGSGVMRWWVTPIGGTALGACVFLVSIALSWLFLSLPRIFHHREQRFFASSLKVVEGRK